MPEGMIIKGAQGVGKSTTIIAIKDKLIKELSDKGAVITDIALNAGADCKTGIEFNGKKLFILSVGDEVAVLGEHYEPALASSVDFVLGVARTSGKTINFWQDRLTCKYWKKKLVVSDAEQQELVAFGYDTIMAFLNEQA